MSQIGLVVFDLDDTLLNTAKMEEYTRLKVIKHLFESIPNLNVTKCLYSWQRLMWYFRDVRSILEMLPIEIGASTHPTDQILTSATELYETAFWDTVSLNDGAVEVLEILKSRNIPVGLLSNGEYEHQMKKLRLAKLLSYFPNDLIWIAEPHSPGAKPFPAGLLTLCRKASSGSEQSVYVGDRKADIVAGRLAGMITMLYAGHSIESREPSDALLLLETPHATIDHLSQVIDYLSSSI